jgi:hypothetical protein
VKCAVGSAWPMAASTMTAPRDAAAARSRSRAGAETEPPATTASRASPAAIARSASTSVKTPTTAKPCRSRTAVAARIFSGDRPTTTRVESGAIGRRLRLKSQLEANGCWPVALIIAFGGPPDQDLYRIPYSSVWTDDRPTRLCRPGDGRLSYGADGGDLKGTGDSGHANDCLERKDGPNVRTDLGDLGTFGQGRYT